MEITRELREEMIIKDSWIPQTPYKPLLTSISPIYLEREGNQQEQANWGESEKYPAVLLPAPRSDSTAGCLRPTASSGTAAVIANSFKIDLGEKSGTGNDSSVDACAEFSMDTVSGLNNLGCADLLALADAAAMASVQRNYNMAMDSSFSITTSQIDGRGMESGHPVFSFMNPGFSVGANTWIARSESLQKSQSK